MVNCCMYCVNVLKDLCVHVLSYSLLYDYNYNLFCRTDEIRQ